MHKFRSHASVEEDMFKHLANCDSSVRTINDIHKYITNKESSIVSCMQQQEALYQHLQLIGYVAFR